MRRTVLAKSAGHAPDAQSQLKKLYPLLASIGINAGAKPTAASIATATMHTPTGGGAGYPHREDCPVNQRHFPLVAIQDERSFLTKPCPLCLKQRVNFLASELFCNGFEEKCTRKSKTSTKDVPVKLDSEISKHFREFASFEKEFLLFAENAMTPGRTWLVYRETKSTEKLSFVNLPANQLPFAFGLWPLAVINMTEEVLCQTLATLEKEAMNEAAEYPSWSRAARNPAGRIAAISVANLQPQLTSDLNTVKKQAARNAFASLDWDFAQSQWQEAKAYFASDTRSTAQLTRRKAVEEVATQNALKYIKDSRTVIVTTKGMEQEGANSTTDSAPGAAQAPKKADTKESSPPPETKVEASGKLADAAAPRSTADAKVPDSVTGVQEKVIIQTYRSTEKQTAAQAASSAATSANTEPIKRQLGDGTLEYVYPNGDVTLVAPDGTQVFRTAGVTTTVYTNGSILYEYANKSSILDRADGVRVTTYPNGTIKEEKTSGGN